MQVQLPDTPDVTARDQVQQAKEAIEAIESSTPDRRVVFNWVAPDGRPAEVEFIQAELGMFAAQEFTTLITEVVNSFLDGEMGMKIGELFSGQVQMPTEMSPAAVNGVVDENMALIKAFVQVVQIAPGLQLDILCLSLGIPRKQREWAKEQMQEPPHRGGLSVDDGFDLLTWFIKQNAELIRTKAMGKARELVDVFQLEVLGKTPDLEPTPDSSTEEPESLEEPFTSPGGTPSSTSSPATPESV